MIDYIANTKKLGKYNQLKVWNKTEWRPFKNPRIPTFYYTADRHEMPTWNLLQR